MVRLGWVALFKRRFATCLFLRNPWKVHATFRVRIKSLDAFDQTHYKFRHNGIMRPGLERVAGIFCVRRCDAKESKTGHSWPMGATQMVEFCEHPQKGEAYEVTTAFRADVLTMWKAPFTGGYEKTIPAGLRFVIAFDPSAAATAVTADAEPSSNWEEILVDAQDRENPKYNGFYLVIPFKFVNENCKRLAGGVG